MVKMKQTLQADVIKVGHHGAKTSSNTEFLKVVKPKYAVISVGKNAYGHPTKDVLNRFKAVSTIVIIKKQSVIQAQNPYIFNK
jgi:beta-lactamase superfamily II metal-dependent hydrolase